jgi:hypothetical protein
VKRLVGGMPRIRYPYRSLRLNLQYCYHSLKAAIRLMRYIRLCSRSYTRGICERADRRRETHGRRGCKCRAKFGGLAKVLRYSLMLASQPKLQRTAGKFPASFGPTSQTLFGSSFCTLPPIAARHKNGLIGVLFLSWGNGML